MVTIDVILYKGCDDIEIVKEFVFDVEYSNRTMSDIVHHLKDNGYDVSLVKLSQWHHVVTKFGYQFYMNLTHDHKQSNETTIKRMSKLNSIVDEV